MSRANGPIATKEIMVKGRHSVGRAENRSSTGRHGQKMPGTVSDEEIQSTRFGRVIRAIGTVAKKAGQATAVLVLACAVGSAVACSEGGGLKVQPDSGIDTDTDSEVDTDTDTDTDTEPLGPECGIYEGADHETVLAKDERELLGPVGHWMEVVNLSFNEQVAEVMFMNEGEDNVNFDGEVVEDGDLTSYYVFDLEDKATLTVNMGGIEQTITLCGVYELEDGTLIAHLIIDNEDGFMHCAYVNSGSLADAGEYAFNAVTTQSVQVMSHSHGFIPDIETGEDEECPGSVQDFIYEESSYVEGASEPIDVGLVPVPGLSFSNMVRMRGTAFHFCETGVDPVTNVYMKVAGDQESDTLADTFQSIEVSNLEVTWMGVGVGGEPLFSYDYPGATYISEEDVSANEKIVRVWVGSDILEFSLRFSTPNPFWSNELAVHLLSDVQTLMPGSQVVVNGETYDVDVYTTTGQEIDGFRLTPVVEED